MKKDLLIRSINLSCKKIGSNRILFVYSKEYGLIKLSGQKLAGRSQSFVENLFWIREQKNTDIYVIRKSEFQRNFQNLSTDYEKILLALKYCFYLQKTSHYRDEKSSQIYKLLLNSLEKLDFLSLQEPFSGANQIYYSFYELEFLFKLTDLLGYRINFRACSKKEQCNLKKNLNCAWLDFQEGIILCDFCKRERNTTYEESKQKKQIKLLPKVFLSLEELRKERIFSQEELRKKQKINSFLLSLLQNYLSLHADIKLNAFYQE